MRVAILSAGTRGDVQPYLVLGEELRSRGHEVKMLCSVNLRAMVQRAGFSAEPIPFDSHAFLLSPEGRKILGAGSTLRFLRELRRLDGATSNETNAAVLRAVTDADVIVSGLILSYRAAFLARSLGRPLVLAYTFPVEPTAAYPSPFASLPLPPLQAARRLSHRIFELMAWLAAAPSLRQLGAQLGQSRALPGHSRRLRATATPTLNLISPLVIPEPPDWPAHVRNVGSVKPSLQLRARIGEGAIDSELAAWLAEGEPPLFFGFGSMPVVDPAGTLALIRRAARRLRSRALIGAGWTHYGAPPGRLSEQLYITGPIDHDLVLRRCSAAIHHGGAGTTHAAIRAGVPALVTPMFADQLLWARRVRDLGIGALIPFRRLSDARLQAGLEAVLAAPLRRRAAAIGRAVDAERGERALADAIEQASERSLVAA